MPDNQPDTMPQCQSRSHKTKNIKTCSCLSDRIHSVQSRPRGPCVTLAFKLLDEKKHLQHLRIKRAAGRQKWRFTGEKHGLREALLHTEGSVENAVSRSSKIQAGPAPLLPGETLYYKIVNTVELRIELWWWSARPISSTTWCLDPFRSALPFWGQTHSNSK